jgi:tryptophanyl-tRNA synthetase
MAERIDPWGSGDIGDYRKLIDAFGIEPMDKYRNRFQDNHYIRRGIIFGHRDFGKIADAITHKEPYAMMTGLMPSGKFHFGHKMVADEIIWFQQHNAKIFVCAADVESYLMRDISFEEAKNIAVTEYLENYLALGLKPKDVTFWFQSNYRNEYYKLRDMVSKRVTFNELQAIYGELTPGKIISVLMQAADILHPQLPELGGPKPVVVPVGVDQDPHLRLTRDIASRLSQITITSSDGKIVYDPNSVKFDQSKVKIFGKTMSDGTLIKKQELNLILPSATYHKFMHGLQGGKMSSSNPASYIALTDGPEEARRKVLSAKTGGRATAEEQKRLGGVPDSCSVYELYLYHLVLDDRQLEGIHGECTSGGISCGDCKRRCADLLVKFLDEHQKKRIAARSQAEKILRERS